MAMLIAGKEVIRLGDSTTHGGTVISASSTVLYEGAPIARVGDMVSCPQCSGVYPIVSGAPSAFDQTPIARNGDMVACGAKLISRGNMESASASTRAVNTAASRKPVSANALYTESADTQPANIVGNSYKDLYTQPVNIVVYPEMESGIGASNTVASPASTNAVAEDTISTGSQPYVILEVMINNNNIGHAGFRMGEGKSAILYDPAGSYSGHFKRPPKDKDGNPIIRGTGDALYGESIEFEWSDYIAYHLDDGPHVTGYMFKIPLSQAKIIEHLIENIYRGRGHFRCAATVSELLQKSGGVFEQLPYNITPWWLEDDLRELPSVIVIKY